MKKIFLFFALTSTLFGVTLSGVAVKNSRIYVINSKHYKYRGEIKFEFIGNRKNEDISFKLKPTADSRFKISNYKIYQNGEVLKGPIFFGKGNDKNYKIVFELELNSNQKGWEKEKMELFTWEGVNGTIGGGKIKADVTELTSANVRIKASDLSFGKISMTEALNRGATSIKNSVVSLEYELDKRLKDGNINIVYPKEVFIKNEKSQKGDKLKVNLKDKSNLVKKEYSNERVLKLPILSKKNNYEFEIEGKIEPKEFKEKELGKYQGIFRIRAYYDFIVDEELKRNNVEFVNRR